MLASTARRLAAPAAAAVLPTLRAAACNGTAAELGRNTLGWVRSFATAPKDMDEATFNAELKKVGMFSKGKMLLQRYGMVAVGTYGGLYVGTAGTSFLTFKAFDNFGFDPLNMLDRFGVKEDVLYILSMDPGLTALSPWQTSLVLSLLVIEVSEPFRLLATVYLAPALHRRLHPTAVLQGTPPPAEAAPPAPPTSAEDR